MLTEEEFKEWLLHPVTKHLRAWAQQQQQALKDRWAEGEFTDAMQSAMAVRNAGATGACSVYKEIEEMDYETIAGSSDEE